MERFSQYAKVKKKQFAWYSSCLCKSKSVYWGEPHGFANIRPCFTLKSVNFICENFLIFLQWVMCFIIKMYFNYNGKWCLNKISTLLFILDHNKFDLRRVFCITSYVISAFNGDMLRIIFHLSLKIKIV